VEATKLKEEKRKTPKPQEQEGMPQHQRCPPENFDFSILNTYTVM
jgi:hypothetical protein